MAEIQDGSASFTLRAAEVSSNLLGAHTPPGRDKWCPGSAPHATSPNTGSLALCKTFSSNALQLHERRVYCHEMSAKIIIQLKIKVQDTVYNTSTFCMKKGRVWERRR